MNEYPQLRELGVLNPQEIDRFIVNSISPYDVLRIIYARRKGSFLPETRTYRFPRVQKPAAASSGGKQTESVMETNPVLRSVLDELSNLLAARQAKQDITATIIAELESLQEEVAMRSARIRELIEEQ